MATDLRKLFLQQFMQEVLRHATLRKQMPATERAQETSLLQTTSESSDEASPEKEALQKNALKVPRLLPRVSKPGVQQPLSVPFPSGGPHAPLPYKVPTIMLQRRAPSPKVYLAPPTESWLVNLQSLARIQSLLADPTITTIECPGSGLPLMIARGSYVQSTPAHFTTEEIKSIIQEVSERTKIPLGTSGVFKAAIGNLIITAVLSEFVGTRFIIQKKPKAPPSSLPPSPLRRQ